MDFYLKTYTNRTNCVNKRNTPCWVPHMKDIVNIEVQNNLSRCAGLYEYKCESMALVYGLKQATSKCLKPCEKLNYKLIERTEFKITQDSNLVRIALGK